MKTIAFVSAFIALSVHSAPAATFTLHDAVSRAASANYRLKASEFDEAVAAEAVTAAKALYLPRADFQGGYTLQREPQAIQLADKTMETQDPRYAYFNLTINQTLYDFGRTKARADRADFLRKYAAESHRAEITDTTLDVIQAYYRILEERKMLEAADDEVEQMKNHLRVAENLFEQGVVTRNDVLQAEVKLAGARQRRLSTANRVEQGWLLLNYLTANPAGFRADLEESGGEPLRKDGEESIERRPELAAARLAIQAAEMEVREAKTDFLPELFARGGVDYTENSKVREQAIMYGSFGMKVNLYGGNTSVAKLRQALARLSQNRERYRDLEQRLRLELDSAHLDADVAAQRVQVAEKAIAQSEENLRINRDRYTEKVGTATEVLDAQALLTQARADYFRAVFDREVAQARVRKARGDL